MKYDVITIGSAVKDIYLFLDPRDAPVIDNPKKDPAREKLITLEFGAKIDVKDSVTTIGGGAVNCGVTFSRLGFKSASVVSIGDDENADSVERAMKNEKIDTRFVQRNKDLPTGFSTLIVAGKAKHDRVVLVERGASNKNNFDPQKRGITKTKWYYASALSGSWKKELQDIALAVRKHKIKWAWNPGSSQLHEGLSGLSSFMKACTVFMVNRDEALELTGAENKPKILLKALLAKGPESVIISDGINGIYYADESQMLYMSADKSIKAVEATGAGDSFGSGFVAGLLDKDDIEYALDLGITNSESVIRKVGAQQGILRKKDADCAVSSSNHTLKKI
ncbi:hypothetical protein CL632_00455 [bacterium]|jgi:sugar/nucleoside kinase (ribokinase family)|nr:hypothetical protein [bacterium]MDP6571361.1 carbohydrate kinase family protein [Patescibacteria group bacterium]MDP6756374.1 carbohydrate kinase family protein [Patescibacteria group bacterium]|tara:strand:- start:4176 stop:5183 length:1008 start_codon:yes stop_codon:yes gene_type:complete